MAEEFNERFNDLVKSCPQNIRPTENALLIFCIQAFDGEMGYLLEDKGPTNVREAQDKAIKIETNMQAAGISSVLGFSKSSSPEPDNVKKVENQEPQSDSIDKLTQLIKEMEVSHANQLATMQANQIALQNKVLAIEKDKGNNHNPVDRWQKGLPKGPPYQEPENPPKPLETNNWFNDPVVPYCRVCDDSHKEGTSPIFFQIVKTKLAARERMEQVNLVGRDFVFDSNDDLLESIEDNKDMICINRNMDKVEEVCDHNLTPKFYEFSDNNSSDDLGG